MKKVKKFLGFELSLLSPDKQVSNLQMTLTLLLVLALVLSNIMVVKTVDLFGLPYLANSCALIAFPITYMLSDVFSEVYGYKWSRTTATWAFLGTLICSLMFQIMIALPGNAAWENQDALAAILGNTPQIAIASVVAYWFGDFANDRVFQYMKQRSKNGKGFQVRSIASSLAGKYVDGFIFTFLGLSFLPLETKIIMVANAPFVQICLETLLLPLTTKVMKAVKKREQKNAESRELSLELGANSETA
jgi:uncharacterized integral membrane protein (TIGR00697 family)